MLKIVLSLKTQKYRMSTDTSFWKKCPILDLYWKFPLVFSKKNASESYKIFQNVSEGYIRSIEELKFFHFSKKGPSAYSKLS